MLAKNSYTAWKSSFSRYGNSFKISPSVIPEARYEATSYTVKRRPRMQGLPPIFPASTVIRGFNPVAIVTSLASDSTSIVHTSIMQMVNTPCFA